ncbi:MAG TPA: hypothetical protein VMM38_06240 [Aridibacter sp.]|nr:hypothetical protein [Aridibacter sp.]
MQDLPKKGEKKNPSNADDADSRPDSETERTDEDCEPGRSYYYDDAYGYEDYDPTDEDEPKDAEETGAF